MNSYSASWEKFIQIKDRPTVDRVMFKLWSSYDGFYVVGMMDNSKIIDIFVRTTPPDLDSIADCIKTVNNLATILLK